MTKKTIEQQEEEQEYKPTKMRKEKETTEFSAEDPDAEDAEDAEDEEVDVDAEDAEDAEDDEDDEECEDDADDADDERIPIDLSQNEVYKGICTLFEDEEGNNILEYISLIHTELIGMNKSLEFLRGIKKDLSRIADCAEIMAKGKKSGDSDGKEKRR
jgi:hypothetical protein